MESRQQSPGAETLLQRWAGHSVRVPEVRLCQVTPLYVLELPTYLDREPDNWGPSKSVASPAMGRARQPWTEIGWFIVIS